MQLFIGIKSPLIGNINQRFLIATSKLGKGMQGIGKPLQ